MSQGRIPEITHLQFLVLGMLRSDARLGREIRRDLARHGARRSGPAFYQMMARLEDAGLIDGEYDQKVVRGQIIKERRYEPDRCRRNGLALDAGFLRVEDCCLRRVERLRRCVTRLAAWRRGSRQGFHARCRSDASSPRAAICARMQWPSGLAQRLVEPSMRVC